jgi:hypothetical protein
VREDFAHQPACQVLEVACPDLLYRVALSDPRKNGVLSGSRADRGRRSISGVESHFLEEYGTRSSPLTPTYSMTQKTATIKVSRSTGSDLLRFDWFGHHRAWGGLLCYSTVQRNMHLGLARRWPGCRTVAGYGSSVRAGKSVTQSHAETSPLCEKYGPNGIAWRRASGYIAFIASLGL